MKTYKELVENAPILEFDTDNASQAKEYFFKQGKKNFEDFNKVMELGIDKCIIFFPDNSCIQKSSYCSPYCCGRNSC